MDTSVIGSAATSPSSADDTLEKTSDDPVTVYAKQVAARAANVNAYLADLKSLFAGAPADSGKSAAGAPSGAGSARSFTA
jgi:hypothetical protein